MPFLIAQAAGVLLTPGLAAAGAAAVSIPVAIHLLSRMRRQREPWAAMRFLAMAYRRHRRKLRFESWLLLALRCLIVGILGLALAGPMLGGCVGQLAGGVSPGTQMVYLVVDDSMASAAAAGGEQSRLDKNKQAAKQIVQALGPDDRAVVWRGSRPARAVMNEPTSDREKLRQAIARIEPTPSRSAVAQALSGIEADLKRRALGPNRASVVLLSHWSAGSRFLSEPASEALGELSKHARVWATRPSASAENVQVADLKPQRGVILPGGTGGAHAQASVPVSFQLQRTSALRGGLTTKVRLGLLSPEGETISSKTRSVTWNRGQSQATATAALGAQSMMRRLGPDQRQRLAIQATLLPGGSGDSLAADNCVYGLVEIRGGLKVGLINTPANSKPSTESESDSDQHTARSQAALSPQRWLRLALQPGIREPEPIAIRPLTPLAVDRNDLANLDAAIILRPDQLNQQAWENLQGYAQRGGLVWIFPAANDSALSWTSALEQTFGFNWQIGLETVRGAAAFSERQAEDAGGSVNSNAIQMIGPSPPPAWSLLAANLSELLRPVRVSQALDLHTPADSAWLELTRAGTAPADSKVTDAEAPDSSSEDPSREVWAALAHQSVEGGPGAVLLSGLALDLEWTNLMAKPLFVALVQETLRGVIGEPDSRRSVIAGDQPRLPPQMTQQIRRVLPGDSNASGPSVTVDLTQTDTGPHPVEALLRPGVYESRSPGEQKSARLVVVNPDPSAAQTHPIGEPALRHWLSSLGSWSFLDPEAPATLLTRASNRPRIGWHLLWLVLALVLTETLFARRFSHAEAGTAAESSGWTSRLRTTLRRAAPTNPTTRFRRTT